MKPLLLVLAVNVLVACAQSSPSYVLTEQPHKLCSTFLSEEGIQRKHGPDFELMKWKIEGGDVFIYVGSNPNFPGMEEIRKKRDTPSSVVERGRVVDKDHIRTLYAFAGADGTIGYADVSVKGSPEVVENLTKKVGDGLQVCSRS